MSVLKAAVKRLFLFVNNSFPFIIMSCIRVLELCLQASINLDVRPSTGR
ncbi:MAG: hypothetical protein ACI35Y_04875 [Candidatus Limimorpha sp.]